ncbi:hypothetical protein [Methyloceanibacter sp. wino2]|uniref:hypothetical protein n=1 Tax=Methyloceanibacter sp. wino2 TaxID=2170729 RepID=UPI00131F05F1|nr:hypothetical protein [Methyloceanibacter sp. wino2]
MALLRRCLLAISPFLSLIIGTMPAFAEVCDKGVGEYWRLADGPAWLLNPAATSFNPIGFPITLSLLAIGLVCVAYFRLWWLAFPISAWCILVSLLLVANAVEPGPFYEDSLREGCLSPLTNAADIAIWVAFAATYFLFGYRASRIRTT